MENVLVPQNGTLRTVLESERGMTLIEILVVLIILGILMTFLGGKIWGQKDQAMADITKSMMQQLKGDIETFRLRYSSLPQSLEDLTRCGQLTGEGCVPVSKEDNLLDAWKNRFVFSLDGNGRSYRIKSLGADGRDGGDGVNYDITLTGP